MHMADALISPAVGGAAWAVSAGAVAWSSRRIQQEADERKVPLMGVLGAFLFAAQMINFAIPGTGSSGHLGGGLLLAILLGPHAGLLVITSVLIVQALFFADGGLLALGCNIFNMGIIPAFIAYPLVYQPLSGSNDSSSRRTIAVITAAILSLQLGPFCVVLETLFSGLTALPFSGFFLMMQPIHLAIGIVEGLITAAVVTAVYQARPELMQTADDKSTQNSGSLHRLATALALAAVITGGGLSQLASEYPDGLEWAIAKSSGTTELQGISGRAHTLLAEAQQKSAFLPDYSFRKGAQTRDTATATAQSGDSKVATSISGLVGGLLTMGLLMLAGLVLSRKKTTRHPA